MNNQGYTTTFTVDQSPKEVFDAINDVRSWWSGDPGAQGDTDKLGAEFTYAHKEFHYTKQRITEFVPGKKIVWLIIESSINFVKDKNEWKGTEVIFDIEEKDGKTNVRFTHKGLVPAFECYDNCSSAWSSAVASLREFITTGKPQKDL